jgi:UDP-4-amino-4-deoxy-L-arabinose formyltransferase/UDP-glucuronic acid dehydrogenase (UDP-4-keto-hexauronic acid decarboxylating)
LVRPLQPFLRLVFHVTVNVLLVAEESAGVQCLEMLADGPHELAGVVTGAQQNGTATVAAAARTRGLEPYPSALVRESVFATWVAERYEDVLLNVHSLHIVHQDVLSACRIGAFNLHPGPLPEYAGLNVPSWAIYNGEDAHAVTLHWMEPEVDAGPIAYERRFAIDADETGLSLTLKCVRHGLPLVEQLLKAAERGRESVPRREQDPALRRYFGREVPNSGTIRWSDSARRVVDFVRASNYAPFVSPWGRPRTSSRQRELLILQASRTGKPAHAPPGTVRSADNGSAYVAACDEWVCVSRVEFDGRACSPSAVFDDGERLGSA